MEKQIKIVAGQFFVDPQDFVSEFNDKYGRRYSKFLRIRQSIQLFLVLSFLTVLFISFLFSIPGVEQSVRSNFISMVAVSLISLSLMVMFSLHVITYVLQVIAQESLGYRKSQALNYHVARAFLADTSEEKWGEFEKIDKILRKSSNTELAEAEEQSLRTYVSMVNQVEEDEKHLAIEGTVDEYVKQYIYEKSLFRTESLDDVINEIRGYGADTFRENLLSKIRSKKLEYVVNSIFNYPNRSVRIISTVILIIYFVLIYQNLSGIGLFDGIIGAMYVQIVWKPEKAISEMLALKGFFANIFDEIIPD